MPELLNASSSSSAVTVTLCAVDQLPVVNVSSFEDKVVPLTDTPPSVGTARVTVTLPVGTVLSSTSYVAVAPSSISPSDVGVIETPGPSSSITVTETESTLNPVHRPALAYVTACAIVTISLVKSSSAAAETITDTGVFQSNAVNSNSVGIIVIPKPEGPTIFTSTVLEGL